jgi:N-acetylated-alpha-linked acidic dipeptidase
MQRLSARPHHVGSPYDKDNAEWILAKFKEWGLDAHIETFEVLFPTPKSRALELVAPEHFTAKLAEPTVAVDPTSGQHDEQLPTYNAYSIDGDVTAPLVYVNYGVPEDYEQLDRLGVSVKGRHRDRALRRFVARHQAQGRGRARRHRLHHLFRPAGRRLLRGRSLPARALPAADGVQRGSVMDMPVYPGDPLDARHRRGPPTPSAWPSRTRRR